MLLLALSLAVMGSASFAPFPDSIPLPNGFQPEGIASGDGTTFYVGSIPTGAIYRGDLRTGEGEVLVQPMPGVRNAIGLKYDLRTGLLFVAGGPTGKAFVYNAGTGGRVTEIQLSTASSFIYEVVITQDGAYFTNSSRPEIYRIIVNSAEGALYRVDPETGEAAHVLEAGSVPNGDGLLLHGKTLYVVQNRLNQIAVIELAPDYRAGTIESVIDSPPFRVPTTIARFGNALYAVNARFGTPPTPDTDYNVVCVPLN